MKLFKIIIGVLLALGYFHAAYSQPQSNPVYLFVHGTWGGGWAFKKVDSLLTANNYKVFRPTLTGLGERSHLASKNIGLKTHITDIVNTILYEDLHQVILVGHSYGGMVVTGVADSIPERIYKLVYLDAHVPENNESSVSIRNSKGLNSFKIEDGFLMPTWVKEGQLPPSDVPHPLKTWTDTIKLDNPERLNIATTFILTVEKGVAPQKDAFFMQSERAREKGWPVLLLEANHNAQWSAPDALVSLLLEIGKE